MISSCRDLLLVSLLAAFIFLGLSLVRTCGDIIIISDHIIMSLSKSESAAVTAGFIAGSFFTMWIEKKKIKALDEKISRLKGQLCNTEKSFADVDQKITELKDLDVCINVRILENQREQFRLDLEDVQMKWEKIREKLQVLERQTENTEEHLRDRETLLNVKQQLERRKEELEQLQLNTERLLQSTKAEGLMLLVERTMTLKNDMKQLHERLQEAETEREELQHPWYCALLILCLIKFTVV